MMLYKTSIRLKGGENCTGSLTTLLLSQIIQKAFTNMLTTGGEVCGEIGINTLYLNRSRNFYSLNGGTAK